MKSMFRQMWFQLQIMNLATKYFKLWKRQCYGRRLRIAVDKQALHYGFQSWVAAFRIKGFLQWRLKSKTRRVNRSVDTHRVRSRLHRALCKLSWNVFWQHEHRQHAAKHSQVKSVRDHALLSRIFSALKSHVKLQSQNKILEMEHQIRRMKIQNFVIGRQDSEKPRSPAEKVIDGSRRVSSSRNAPLKKCIVEQRGGVQTPQMKVSRGGGMAGRAGSGKGERLHGSSGLSKSRDTVSPLSPAPSPLKTVPVPHHYTSPARRHCYRSADDEADTEDEDEAPPPYDYDEEIERRKLNLGTGTANTTTRKLETSPLRSPARPSQRTGSSPALAPLAAAQQGQTRRTKTERPVGGRGLEAAESRREKLKAMRELAAARVLAKRREDEETKRQRTQEEDEKFQIERKQHRAKLLEQKRNNPLQKEAEKKQLEAMRQKRRVAEAHYNTQLIIQCGFSPWCRYIQECRYDWEKACTFYEDGLLSSAWNNMLGYCVSQRKSRYRLEHRLSGMAASHYRKQIIRWTWNKWKGHRRILLAKGSAVYSQAVVYAARKYAFKAWAVSFERSRRHHTTKLVRFSMARRIHIMRSCVHQWRAFIRERHVEREIDSRVDHTWAQVQRWLK